MNSHKLAIEERRRQVASLLAKCKTQQQIAEVVGVDQSTISDDIKALRMMSQQFIFDLAKSDLGYYYKSCIDGITEAKKEAWRIYDKYAPENTFTDEDKLKLQALKVIIAAEEAKFKLLQSGPDMMVVQAMQERVENLERTFQETHR